MADVIRLRIVYEVERAASGLVGLNRVQTRTHAGMRQIESGMKSLAVSALGIPGPIGKVAEGLLKFGTGGMVTLTVVAGIGLIAGAYKLAADEASRFEKINTDTANQLSGQFGGARAKLIDDLNKARESLEKLNKAATALAGPKLALTPGGIVGTSGGGVGGFFTRMKANIFGSGSGTELIAAQKAVATTENLILQISNAITESLRDQTAERQKQLEIAQKEEFLLAGEFSVMQGRSFVDMRESRSRTLGALEGFQFGQGRTGPRSLDLGFGQRPDSPLRSLDTNFQGAKLGLGPRPEELITNELTREQQRLVDHWTAGMQTMQDAMEDFLVTGKLSIQALADEFLRIAFRAATDQFVDKAVDRVTRMFAK
jgi:hypothetical protein